MFKLYIINCFHSGSMSKYIITESDFCLFFRDKCLFNTFAQHTVNVVIFAGGKFRENVGKTFHAGVIFTILLFFLYKVIWVLFSRGGNFREEDQSAKIAKITPTRKFHVYSIC